MGWELESLCLFTPNCSQPKLYQHESACLESCKNKRGHVCVGE